MCQLIFALTGCRQLQLDTLTGECYESTSNFFIWSLHAFLSPFYITLDTAYHLLIHIVLYSV